MADFEEIQTKGARRHLEDEDQWRREWRSSEEQRRREWERRMLEQRRMVLVFLAIGGIAGAALSHIPTLLAWAMGK